MFLNISLKSKGKYITTIFVTLIVVLVLAILLMLNLIYKTKNGIVIKNKLDLSFLNYYTQYDMTVISNKNIHTYNVKEWHKEGVITKLEYLDYIKNIVTITLENNTLNISNSGNTAKLIINNMYENKNIASLSTFGYLYNLACQGCGCSKVEHIKDKELTITIIMKADCSCECNKIAEDLGVSKLELILVDNVPKNYTVYDKNQKEYISIVYNIFEKNI